MLSLILLACKGSENGLAVGEDSALLAAEDELWTGASLQVVQPVSGSFLPWEETSTFEARIVDAEGNTLEGAEVKWSSDVDDEWVPSGALVEDDTLGIGTHALTATALLPNGDRLAYTVGGVLVQHESAGTYTGTVVVDLTYDAYTVACSGAATVIVDQKGNDVTGTANCLLSFQGYDLDGAYTLEADNDDGEVDGEMALDVYGYPVEMEFDGEVEEGVLEGTFEGELFGSATFAGELAVTRISRDTVLTQ